MGSFVIALTNMERMYVYGEARGLADEVLEALVRLVVGLGTRARI